jgi:transcriptional regulator with XRE-family HTH domain
MAEIADEIGGASVELVERVLGEYGDPAGDGPDEGTDGDGPGEGTDGDGPGEGTDGDGPGEGTDGDGPGEECTSVPAGEELDDSDGRTGADEHTTTRDASEPEMETDQNGRREGDHTELSEKQLRALRLIEEHPDASQGELAEEFDVTRATVSRWLNAIPGFEWPRRAEHASEILNGGEIRDTDGPVDSERLGEFDRRLDAIERRLDGMVTGDELVTDDEGATDAGMETGGGTAHSGLDPELAHKVVHACLNSERITEDEELRLLKELMGN